MSTVKVGAIRGVSASSDAITVASDGTCTANITSVGGGPLSNRNLSINGADMMIAQRGTSTTGLQNTGGLFTVDRFAHRRSGTFTTAQFKHEQVASGSGLFQKALKATCTTAEGSAVTGTQCVMIGHYLEAQDSIAAFGDGTAEAKSFTISFYVKASIATTYCLHVSTSHLSTNKAYMKQFTVNSAGTWERKTCTIPALTNSIATVNASANDTGLRIHWVLDAATGTAAADSWHTLVGGDFKYPSGLSPSGFANTLNATFELSGVQIEAGTVATDLEHKTFGQELQLCKRYYQKSYPYSVAPGTPNSPAAMIISRYSAEVTNRPDLSTRWEVEMRATPTLTTYRPFSGGATQVENFASGIGTVAGNGRSYTVQNLGATGFGGFTLISATSNTIGYHYEVNAEV